MITANPHYKKLQGSYLFSRISKILEEERKAQPNLDIIKLGIGDVTKPLSPAVIKAFHQGVDDMATEQGFRGYGPEQGYEFLREIISTNEFPELDIKADEIIVSDGSKCDVANIQELFTQNTSVALPDPVYPVYVDSNVMAGRSQDFKDGRYEGIHYLEGTQANNFVPPPPAEHFDLIYLCFPNNPTGQVASHADLERYVTYALEHNALILFDAAYCAFIQDSTLPKSIYEIPHAKKCAVEFRSFSKTAGFTGTRCAFTVIPKECRIFDAEGKPTALHDLWIRRHSTKFNGVSYPVQRAAAAIYSKAGAEETENRIQYYMHNAKIITQTMETLGLTFYGGKNAPYVWVDTKKSSWDMFTEILKKTGIVLTPGSGFGKNGEGFIRISAFNSTENVETAMQRLQSMF